MRSFFNLKLHQNWRISCNPFRSQVIQTFRIPEDQSLLSICSKGANGLEHPWSLVSSLCRHPPQAFPPIHPRQMRDNVVLRNVRWRKRFSCLPLYNSLFYKKFYRDENPLTFKKETKAKTVNKTSLLSTYLCIHCSLSLCVLVSPIHLFIENVMDPIYLHVSFSGTVVEKQVWCEDFIFLGWEGGIIIIKRKELGLHFHQFHVAQRRKINSLPVNINKGMKGPEKGISG